MTKQELFNLAYLGLAAQGFRKSVNPVANRCQYRAPNGDRCAIGHCIPDEKYLPEMEVSDKYLGWGAFRVLVHAYGPNVGSLAGLARDLQSAHDFSASPENMTYNLCAVAASYGLTVPEVGQ